MFTDADKNKGKVNKDKKKKNKAALKKFNAAAKKARAVLAKIGSILEKIVAYLKAAAEGKNTLGKVVSAVKSITKLAATLVATVSISKVAYSMYKGTQYET